MTTSVVRAFLFAITNKNFTGHTATTIPHAVMVLTKGGWGKIQKKEEVCMRNKTSKNLFKKLVSLVLTMVMVLAMSTTTFAATSDTILSKPDGNNYLWNASVNPGGEATFYVGPANSSYSFTGFDNATDAAKEITWTVSYGESKVEKCTTGTAEISGHGYASTCTVDIADNATSGVVLVEAKRGTQTCDFYVVVEDTTKNIAAKNISVEMYDFYTGNSYFAVDGPMTVQAANGNTSSKFHGDPSAAQYYATAADTLDNMIEDNAIANIDASYGYISGISMYDDNGNATKMLEGGYSEAGYYGWMYGVIRDGKYVEESLNLSAAVFDLQDGDTVLWVYGYQSDAVEYFRSYGA